MSSFSIEIDASTTHCRLALSGEIDLAERAHLTDVAIQCINQTDALDIEIDLDQVTFIDSTGLGALVEIRRAAQSLGRDIVLTHVRDRVAKILAITALDRVFTVRPAADGGPAAAAEATDDPATVAAG
jgi:anti-sigma B factor antagonist